MPNLTLLVGNTYEPHQYLPSGRSAFQDIAVRRVAEDPETDFFCGCPALEPGSLYRGPFALLYYTRDGRLHCRILGVRRELRHLTA